MVFQLPPIQPDKLNEKIPDMNPIQNNKIKEEKEIDPLEKFKFKDVFNLPISIILQNIANALLLILDDILEPENYKSPKAFLKIFLIENRMIYLGLFVILLSFFIALFFPYVHN